MTAELLPTTEEPLLLRPVLHRLFKEVVEQPQLLHQLIMGMGSPLNVVLPDVIGENVRSFWHAFQHHPLVEGQIYFAHKPTQSHALLRQMAATRRVGVDVSSVGEIQHAAASGFNGQRMLATGPNKSTAFLTLCILQQVVISVDTLEELRHILAVRDKLHPDYKTKVLLRVTGFDQSVLAMDTRFGIHVDSVVTALELLKDKSREIELLGFGFHIDSTSLRERLTAINHCLKLFKEAFNRGLRPRVLDIGGGFKVNYLEHKEDWTRYMTALQQATLGQRAPITWQKAGFGFSVDNGHLRGAFTGYQFHEARPGMIYLCDILGATLSEHEQRVDEMLGSNMIEVWIEPGLSLLDQAGFTVARVGGVRNSSQGHPLILLDMKRSDLVVLEREFFVDPVILYQNPQGLQPMVPVFFAGNLCLESDLIYRHLTWVPQIPQAGDLVVFPNTAGYSMDFSATTSIMQPRARKVAVSRLAAGDFVWMMDEEFYPTWMINS